LDDMKISMPSILGISRYVDDRGFRLNSLLKIDLHTNS